jgi:outer membrane protein OmpA-like peptidoglycan-associated protein
LAGFSIDGFGYKSSSFDSSKWEAWAKKAAPVIKEITGKLPDGYVLQVTGHTDASGPEEPETNKPGNIKISTDRAKAVYDALIKAYINTSKITYKGAGSTELLNIYAPRSAEQRRVTFKIMQMQ